MSQYRFHSSSRTPRFDQRKPMDPTQRALAYGPVQSMYEPTWLERLVMAVTGRR